MVSHPSHFRCLLLCWLHRGLSASSAPQPQANHLRSSPSAWQVGCLQPSHLQHDPQPLLPSEETAKIGARLWISKTSLAAGHMTTAVQSIYGRGRQECYIIAAQQTGICILQLVAGGLHRPAKASAQKR